MRTFVLVLALAAMAGCASAERQAEDAMRKELSKLGEVEEVEFSRPGRDGDMTGHAVVRTADGEVNMECTGRRLEGTQYDFKCAQEIDERVVAQTEDLIRTRFRQQGVTIQEIDLRRDGEDRMAGTARATDADGNSGELACTAVRKAEGSTDFDIQCR
jgi:hypothetical protein